jgi:alpha-D-xyloside xylohydrolase
MRPLYYDFPADPQAAETEDCYMFGPKLLVAPVMEAGAKERTIYLPKGARWKDAYTGREYEGGQTVTVPAPLEIIPVMIRDGAEIDIYG